MGVAQHRVAAGPRAAPVRRERDHYLQAVRPKLPHGLSWGGGKTEERLTTSTAAMSHILLCPRALRQPEKPRKNGSLTGQPLRRPTQSSASVTGDRCLMADCVPS